MLEGAIGHVEESMGLRDVELHPRLSPTPSSRDVGRRRDRTAGVIDINQVIPDPKQPRTEFDEASLARFADSIRRSGQLAPIRVRWSPASNKWIIIAGERRWRAARQAGLETITCMFVESELSQTEILEQQLIENLMRENLRPIEEARGFATLMKLNHWNGKQVAEALSVPASKVSRALVLLDLPADLQERVEAGELAARAAYEVCKLPDENSRRRLAEKVISSGMTHAETAKAVRSKRGKTQRNKPGRSATGLKAEYWAENGAKTCVVCKPGSTYHDVKEALMQAIDETELRINGNIRLT